MATASQRNSSADAVAQAARAALKTANGDVRTASVALEARVRRDRALRDALTDPLLATACYTAVAVQVRQARRSVWAAPAASRQEAAAAPQRRAPEDARRVAQLAAGTLAMFPLPGGKRLGEATREEIAAAASFYEAQSADMADKARWLRLIAQSVPHAKKVGDVLNERRLRELQTEARRG
ncbi:hypothetical protein [Methylobacterium sp. CCH5-D2]|uniref:hypothetical protein n=1 Tax=Methylobacterium sp. CCH5-D2 TaxID=1768765 RepID=UPI000A57E94F|nr:hypothetical protein [Methylobacterium sp. CCH5-D2]